jgi:predicted ribosome quality control (RQC) complex YloA/Tae2 family protein
MNEGIVLIISNALTAFASFFVGRRKTEADSDNAILNNLAASINIYKTIIDDLKEEIHQLNIKVEQLEKKVDLLTEENTKLRGYGKSI